MSRMKGKPFIVNGDGSDLVFMKTGARDNKNMAVPATKYSQVPEVRDCQVLKSFLPCQEC